MPVRQLYGSPSSCAVLTFFRTRSQIARGISRQLLTVMVATPLVAKSLWHAIDVILGRLWPKAAAFAHRWLALPFDILLIPTIAAAVVPILFASYDGTQGESYAAAAKKGA